MDVCEQAWEFQLKSRIAGSRQKLGVRVTCRTRTRPCSISEPRLPLSGSATLNVTSFTPHKTRPCSRSRLRRLCLRTPPGPRLEPNPPNMATQVAAAEPYHFHFIT